MGNLLDLPVLPDLLVRVIPVLPAVPKEVLEAVVSADSYPSQAPSWEARMYGAPKARTALTVPVLYTGV